jgi:hypothetical protein
MSEKATARALMDAIPEQDPQRIESTGTAPGIPDVWCGDCAIETKCLAAYPKKENSPVVLKHKLTLPQYRWLNRRWRAGYKAFVVLQVRRVEWYLFAAPDAFVLVDKHEVSRMKLKMQTLWYSPAGINAEIFDSKSIGEWLTTPQNIIDDYRHRMGLVARWKDI